MNKVVIKILQRTVDTQTVLYKWARHMPKIMKVVFFRRQSYCNNYIFGPPCRPMYATKKYPVDTFQMHNSLLTFY